MRFAALSLSAKQADPTVFGLSFEGAAALAAVIISLLGVVVAVAAWITSQRAANEAKRGVDIAERALALETERRAGERRDQALEQAPQWKPRDGMRLGLEGRAGPFMVVLENVGPAADIESAKLEADGQTLQGVPNQRNPILTGNGAFVRFGEETGGAGATSDCGKLTVVITARAVHNGQRSRYELTLLARSPIMNGVPTWSVGPHRIEPLD